MPSPFPYEVFPPMAEMGWYIRCDIKVLCSHCSYICNVQYKCGLPSPLWTPSPPLAVMVQNEWSGLPSPFPLNSHSSCTVIGPFKWSSLSCCLHLGYTFWVKTIIYMYFSILLFYSIIFQNFHFIYIRGLNMKRYP